MARRKIYEVNTKERYEMLNDFFEMVAGIKDKKHAENFFKDLLTPSEALMITRRIAIAKLLLAGLDFREISKRLRVGSNTINSVNRWLFTGFGGYLNELKKSKSKKEFQKIMPATAWDKIRKKYPAHFMLFNLMDR